MKIFVLTVLLIFSANSFAQNKKEQIIILSSRVDSLNAKNEDKTSRLELFSVEVSDLKSVKKNQNERILLLNKDIDSLKLFITNLNQKNNELVLQNVELQKKNKKYELDIYNQVNCAIGKEIENIEDMSTLQISTCTFRNFKFIDSIYTDDSECLAPECNSFTFYKLLNGKYSQIELNGLFNNLSLLEQEINLRSRNELKEIKNPNNRELFDECSKKLTFKNHSFDGVNDSYGGKAQKIEFFRMDEKGVTFRTFCDGESTCEGFNRGFGMLFIYFSIEELLAYFSE